MPLPEIAPTCEIILAHDASPQTLYTVLSTPVTAAGARSIKVLVSYANIEIPSSPMREEPTVIVNGVARTMSDREPLVITRSIDGKYVNKATAGPKHQFLFPDRLHNNIECCLFVLLGFARLPR